MFHTYDLKSFGDEVRRIRKKSGFTQKDIRKLTGINTDTLRKIENGLVIPKYETLEVLSIVYRYDLLRLLLDRRSESFIQDFSFQIDQLILSNNVDLLDKVILEFAKYKSSRHADLELVEHRHIQQYEMFLQGMKEYYSPAPQNLNAILQVLIKALNITITKFDINSVDEYKYNFFEIRILLFIGIVLRRTLDTDVATKILKHCLDYLRTNNNDEWRNLHLILKSYFNLAYCYHTTDNHELVIQCANIAIDLANKYHSTYFTAHIYYRKGIAEHALGYPNAIESLTRSIQILEIEGEKSLAKKFKNVTYEIYGIQL